MKGQSLIKSMGILFIFIFIIAVAFIISDLSLQPQMKFVLGTFGSLIVIALLLAIF